MIETNIPDINVDELMEKIRAEIRQRKERGGTLHRTVPHANYGPPSNLYAKVDLSKIGSMPDPEPFEYKEEGYHINDFLKYHDQQFVMNAYRGILRRGPDSEAMRYFLKNLRTGKMTKAEVLGRLRYAPEGRANNVKISGLFWNFAIQSSFRIPVLGYFLRLGVGIANLPLIIRDIQVLEASTFTLSQQQRNELASALEKLGPIFERKAERDEVGNLKDQIESVLNGKAERDEVGDLKNQIAAVQIGKADREELGNLRGELESAMDRKAERDELGNLKEQITLVTGQIRDILRQIRDQKLNMIDQQRRLKLLLEEARKRLPEPISTNQIQRMLTEEDHILDAMYVSLEDRERGSREDIKDRLEFYLPNIRKAGAGTTEHPVVDVGCGRGEWLEVLKENGFTGRGVDMNCVMQRECQELGLDVVAGDAVEFLRGLKPNSVGAVTGFHIVEHLPLTTMLPLFREALRVLTPGGIVIFETPNPENIFVGSCTFYTDPTHRNPVPPNTLAFLIEYQGFVEPEIFRLHPLNYIEYEKEDALKDLVYRFNMGQDYAVIARKAS